MAEKDEAMEALKREAVDLVWTINCVNSHSYYFFFLDIY